MQCHVTDAPLASLLKTIWPHMTEFTSGFCILFHRSLSISMLVPCCFDHCRFVICLRSGCARPLALIFFLEIVLAIQGPLRFHMGFRIFFLFLQENVTGILIGVALNLVSRWLGLVCSSFSSSSRYKVRLLIWDLYFFFFLPQHATWGS